MYYNLTDKIEKLGLKLGDEVSVLGVSNRKRHIRLQRTKYFIKKSPNEKLVISGSTIFVPTNSPVPFEYVLSLDKKYQRFVLELVSGDPFYQNELVTFKTYILRKDQVYIADHKFQFDLPNDVLVEDEAIKVIPEKVVASNYSILLQGETGTGKTTLAYKIHKESGRRGEFVHLNISSLTSSLLESELFGHARGAFTGAVGEKIGALEKANHGTLFLDEIDSLNIDLQIKLLLFLDSKKIQKVGSNDEKKLDVRLIFASGRNLAEMAENKLMRQDFYFRLKTGFLTHLKPLRDNPESLKKIIEDKCHAKNFFIDPKLLDFYLSYSWPGNLRELDSHLEKKMLTAENNIIYFDVHDSELVNKEMVFMIDAKKVIPLEQFTRLYVKNTFNRLRKDKKTACKLLDISIKTLNRNLNEQVRIQL
jgi:transcriptional regulator with PAS, ATPase and Fis domain